MCDSYKYKMVSTIHLLNFSSDKIESKSEELKAYRDTSNKNVEINWTSEGQN